MADWQLVYFSNSPTSTSYSWLGNDVAIDGNGIYAAAGAPYFSNLVSWGGIVAVWERDTSTNQWFPFTILDGGNIAWQKFGTAVDISADGQYLIASAPRYNNIGRIYVYTYATTTYNLLTTIDNPDSALHNFGEKIAIDENGDTIVVSAPGYSNGSYTNLGRAYVFKRTGSSYTLLQIIDPPVSANNLYFGRSLAISDDGSTIAIGTKEYSATYTYQGMICVYKFNGTNYQLNTFIDYPAYQNAQFLGNSVSLNYDGSLLLSSMYQYNTYGAGVVYKFNGTIYALASLITTPTTSYNKGVQVALASQNNVLTLTAPSENSFIGNTYMYIGSCGQWNFVDILDEQDPLNSQNAGLSVDISNDGKFVILGAPHYDDPVTNNGAIYIYEKDPVSGGGGGGGITI